MLIAPLPRHAVIPLIVACALFMESLDSTVLATALPTIAEALGENPLRLNLAITSYLLSLAVFIPLSGWVADRFGTRLVFTTAIGVFTLGSVACGLSDSLPMLVGARIVQGLGGAMMVPVGRLAILRVVPKAELVSAMAYLTVPALIGPVIGPPLGGLIVTFTSWRWIFFINIPVGLLGMLLALRYIDDMREEIPQPLDLLGFFLVGTGLVGIMFGFVTAGRDLLPGELVGALLTVGFVSLLLYALHARRTPHRIIDYSVFRHQTYRAALIGGFFFRTSVGAAPFLLPLMLQLGFGLSALASGLLTFVGAAGAMGMKVTASPILRRFGFRRVLIVNALLCCLFLAVNALFTPTTSHAVILVTLLIGGYLRSLQFTSLNTLAYADVTAAQMSRASTIANVERQLSQSFGVGLAALLLHVIVLLRGGSDLLTASDFGPAFIAVGVLSLISLLFFVPLSAQAGDEVSGRGKTAKASPAAANRSDPPNKQAAE
jgi:EmrB/QacA subfamily drug resistance transporter